MFDWLDPVGSVANKTLGIPKTGVTTSADPQNIGEMITSRIPGANGGSIAQDFMNMNTGRGETEDERKRRMAKEAAIRSGQPSMKKGGKVSSASKRADGCAVRGKTKGKYL